jgi:hypothetical protein
VNRRATAHPPIWKIQVTQIQSALGIIAFIWWTQFSQIFAASGASPIDRTLKDAVHECVFVAITKLFGAREDTRGWILIESHRNDRAIFICDYRADLSLVAHRRESDSSRNRHSHLILRWVPWLLPSEKSNVGFDLALLASDGCSLGKLIRVISDHDIRIIYTVVNLLAVRYRDLVFEMISPIIFVEVSLRQSLGFVLCMSYPFPPF